MFATQYDNWKNKGRSLCNDSDKNNIRIYGIAVAVVVAVAVAVAAGPEVLDAR